MISPSSNITCIELAPRSWQDPAKALENGAGSTGRCNTI
jgi:hypothetical protein